MDYKDIVGFWKGKKIKTAAELSAILDSYSINFAFHSGKIENDRITYYDTRDIFTKDGVSSYTGDLRTLFEIRNAKNAYELILNAFEERQPITEDFVKQIQEVLTVNTYDSRRYQLGERISSAIMSPAGKRLVLYPRMYKLKCLNCWRIFPMLTMRMHWSLQLISMQSLKTFILFLMAMDAPAAFS